MKTIILGTCCLLGLMTCFSSCSHSEEEEVSATESFYFMEPVTQWGCSSEEVSRHMTGYSLVSSSPASLVYEGKDSETAYLYAFSQNGVSLSYAVVTFDLSMKDEVIKYMSENYTLQSAERGNCIFSDDEHSTFITTTADDCFRLTYMGYSYIAK